MTDEDYGFRELWTLPDRSGELRLACFYEMAREARPIITEFKRCLRFEKPRAKLFQKAKEQGIEEEALRRAFVEVIQDERFVLWRRSLAGPGGAEEVIPMTQDVDRARKLLSSLSGKYRKIVFAEYNIEKTEDYGRKIGAPHLRFVAKHLVKDTPWLKISKTDRDNAIVAAREYVFSRIVPAIEIADELQELVRSKKALSGMFREEMNVELPTVRIRYDRSDRALRESWAQLGERLVINARPEKWNESAKATVQGKRRPETWCQVALEELAAMRLRHVVPPEAARARFSELYYPRSINGISPRDFRDLRSRFIERFQSFFDTDEMPRHAERLVRKP